MFGSNCFQFAVRFISGVEPLHINAGNAQLRYTFLHVEADAVNADAGIVLFTDSTPAAAA